MKPVAPGPATTDSAADGWAGTGLVGPLRRFAVVSSVVTLVDVAILVVAVDALHLAVALGDAVAVTLASLSSWILHRAVAGAGDPFLRWVDQPRSFVVATVITGGIDVAVVSFVAGNSTDGAADGVALGALIGAKALALVVAGGLRVVAYRVALVAPTRRGLRLQATRAEPSGEVRLSLVVPAYHEQGRIGASVARLAEALTEVAEHGGVEIVVVDDGSGDATAAEAAAAGARVLSLEENRGKGAAVRAGMLAARGRTIAFVDADLAYPPEQVQALLAEVEAGWDVVVGSRRHPRSVDVARPPLLRSLSGRLFNLVTAVVLLGHYRDTQCGCKAFRSDVAQLVFSHTRVDGFAFDVEVFHLVERYRLSLTEIPVTLVSAPGSTVRVVADALAMVRDLFRVRRWSGRGVYDVDAKVRR
ncbi:MAG: glycosyltransferase [Actinomycetota bacterium]|nr:glycosyltransferase [Actinomycetota bacterium]